MNKYKVAFSVDGNVVYNAATGNIEGGEITPAPGYEVSESVGLILSDGRVSYDVEAEDPVEAVEKARDCFGTDDIGDIENPTLRTVCVSFGDAYWNENDLKEMEKESRRKLGWTGTR